MNRHKLALLLEYDGRNYHGFQLQHNAPTVQGALEQALGQLTGEAVRLKGASRTDTGVHALGQVATFETESVHSTETFQAALNFHLPEDISVRGVREVGHDFDARRHATARHYRYVALNRPSRSPLLRERALWVRSQLNVAAMDAGAQLLLGRHDLASFSGPLSRATQTTVRQVHHASVRREEPFILFDIVADAFLPQQVRRTMGVLLSIGRGETGPDQVQQLLDAPVLGTANMPVAPHGLYLMSISYPEDRVNFADAVNHSGLASITAETAGISL